MNQAALLDVIRSEWALWEALLDEIDEAQMIQPGVAGEWSVRDIVAHITWFEREMVGTLQARALAGSDLWQLPADQRNARIFEENRDRPLHDVLAEAQQVHQQLLGEVEALAEDDLVDPHRFPGMPEDWQPWKVIADNSNEHYRDHSQDVRMWLDTLE
jgi:muconolactone delta-isomerase